MAKPAAKVTACCSAIPTSKHLLGNSLPNISNPVPDFNNPYNAVVDGGSEWEYYEPVRPGDRITVRTKIADLFERPGRLGNMLFTIRETSYTNQFEKIVALQRTTGISYEPPE